MSTSILSEALSYLHRGWSVVPCKGKKTFSTWKLFQERLPKESEVQSWFSKGNYNVAVICGALSGVVILDIDGLDGVEALREIIPPDYEFHTPVVQTAQGWHYYFKHPGIEISNRVELFPQVDIRGDGGYGVLPPSIHPGDEKKGIKPGHIYKWLTSPDEVPPQDVPDWLLPLIVKKNQAVQAVQPPPKFKVSIGDYARYTAAAFDRECNELASSPPDGHNHQLNISAFNLGRFVAKGLIARDEVESALLSIALRIGQPDREARATIQSGLEAGLIAPWDLPVLGKGGKQSGATPHSMGDSPQTPDQNSVPFELAINTPAEPLTDEEMINQSDLGNAKRLVGLFSEYIRYVWGMGLWLLWDGTRWARDDRGGIYRAAKNTVISMYKEAELIEGDKARRRFVKFVLISEQRSRLEAMIALAQSEDKIAIRANDLDPDNWLLNCKNGTIDLRTLELKQHDQTDMITKRVDIDFDPTAECPHWHDFLMRILNDDPELMYFIQRAIGYTLTGDVSAQCLFFMFGSGKNGKSTFIETLASLFGEYAIKTPTETIMVKDKNAATNDIARLAGKRLVVAKEVEEGSRIAEATLKDLTGGDTQVARMLYKEFFEFKPTHKLWMYGNHKPIIKGTDEGIWRRIRLIPFTVTIPAEERDPDLPNKLHAELPGILNWALEGCRLWKRDGLGTAKAVDAATLSYRNEMDVIADFLSQCFAQGPSFKVPASKLYQMYTTWCEEGGERAISQRQLGIRLSERGYKVHRGTGGQRTWLGLSPISDVRPM